MPHASNPFHARIKLDAKVAFLSRPAAYPDSPVRVETIETHMSWLFLTDRHVYKLKKPVHHDYLDFRKPGARRFYCEEEVRLNRRLAEGVYLGVVPLSADWRGHLHLDHIGTPIDWLVKMRRLAAHDMLDHALRDLHVEANDIVRIAQRLAAFYRACPPVAMDLPAYLAGLQAHIDTNLRDLCRPEYGLPAAPVERLCAEQHASLQAMRALFGARIEAGRIVEGHGDLRPEHICIRPRVIVIDCLEFSRDLRLVDPVDELGFLTLEIERLVADGYSRLLLHAYSTASGDWPPQPLLRFYKSLRAGVRARIAIRHLDEERFRHAPEWSRRALSYLQLGQRYQDAINSEIEPPQ